MRAREVIVITREPNSNAKREWEKQQAHEQARCYKEMRETGVEMRYKNDLHGKILVFDREVAILSSFNFTRNPASGTSWEAGIVTYEKEIINGIMESIRPFLRARAKKYFKLLELRIIGVRLSTTIEKVNEVPLFAIAKIIIY